MWAWPPQYQNVKITPKPQQTTSFKETIRTVKIFPYSLRFGSFQSLSPSPSRATPLVSLLAGRSLYPFFHFKIVPFALVRVC
ncbi:hypothetical protein SDJN03_06468, partial [Cucurbita argyrosperma subsp. sororia]